MSAATARDRRHVLEVVLEASRRAAALIMGVYATPFAVEFKIGDDPVTRADKEANALLVDALARAFPGVPIVAEESDASTFAGYVGAREAFFVDPLDGTREFVARNGEFCVMVGFAEEGRATAGVVLCPAIAPAPGGVCFLGAIPPEGVSAEASGLGAHAIILDPVARGSEARTPIRVTSEGEVTNARVVVSRTRRPQEASTFFERLGVRAVTPCGSSGIKAARVAEGAAEAYIQPGRGGMLWDACAPEAIVRAAGGAFTDLAGDAFDYRRANLDLDRGVLVTNGALHQVFLDAFREEYEAHRARVAKRDARAAPGDPRGSTSGGGEGT